MSATLLPPLLADFGFCRSVMASMKDFRGPGTVGSQKDSATVPLPDAARSGFGNRLSIGLVPTGLISSSPSGSTCSIGAVPVPPASVGETGFRVKRGSSAIASRVSASGTSDPSAGSGVEGRDRRWGEVQTSRRRLTATSDGPSRLSGSGMAGGSSTAADLSRALFLSICII